MPSRASAGEADDYATVVGRARELTLQVEPNEACLHSAFFVCTFCEILLTFAEFSAKIVAVKTVAHATILLGGTRCQNL